jgi:hypothetical protein
MLSSALCENIPASTVAPLRCELSLHRSISSILLARSVYSARDIEFPHGAVPFVLFCGDGVGRLCFDVVSLAILEA